MKNNTMIHIYIFSMKKRLLQIRSRSLEIMIVISLTFSNTLHKVRNEFIAADSRATFL